MFTHRWVFDSLHHVLVDVFDNYIFFCRGIAYSLACPLFTHRLGFVGNSITTFRLVMLYIVKSAIPLCLVPI